MASRKGIVHVQVSSTLPISFEVECASWSISSHSMNSRPKEASPSKWALFKRWPPTTQHPYVVVRTTDLYRKFADQLQMHGINSVVVVEIGCCNGLCTKKILEHVFPHQYLGMDIGHQFIQECEEKFPDAQFEQINVLMEWDRAQKLIEAKVNQQSTRLKNISPSVPNASLYLFIDIGGNREIESLFALLQTIQTHLCPARILVKSKELFSFGELNGGIDSDVAWEHLHFLAKSALVQRRRSAQISINNTKPIEKSNKKYHPLKLPQRYNSQGIAICRYHNYDTERGCLLHNDKNNHGKKCPFDHERCHSCYEIGHVAWQCPKQNEPLIERLLKKSVS